MRILALESSCDESAVAVYDDRAGLLAHEIYSQIDLHRLYGGVVPELASPDQLPRLLPLGRRAGARGRMPGTCPRWTYTTSKDTCWRRCSNRYHRHSRTWRCWFRAGT